MTLNQNLALVLSIFAFSNVAAAQNDDGCNHWQPWTCWKPAQRLEDSASRYRGVPAWSNQGRKWIGAAVNFEKRYNLANWPLQSIVVERHHTSQIFIQDAHSNAPRINLGTPIAGVPVETFYDETRGQAIIRMEYPLFAYYSVKVGEESKKIIDLPGPSLGSGSGHTSLTPSPQGDVLAFLECTRIEGEGDPANTLNSCSVRFLSADSFDETARSPEFILGEAPYLELNKNKGLVQLDPEFWTLNHTLIVTDYAQKAFCDVEVQADGSLKNMTVPTCKGPSTTSSRLSLQGERVGVKNNKLDKVKNLPSTPDVYNCRNKS